MIGEKIKYLFQNCGSASVNRQTFQNSWLEWRFWVWGPPSHPFHFGFVVFGIVHFSIFYMQVKSIYSYFIFYFLVCWIHFLHFYCYSFWLHFNLFVTVLILLWVQCQDNILIFFWRFRKSDDLSFLHLIWIWIKLHSN